MVILHEKDTWQDCNLIATIGMFDGVHLGHRFLIDELTQTAKKLGKKCAVVTFKDHPQRVFNHTTDLRMIMTLDERLKTIESLGIDVAIVLNFTPEFSKIESRDFIIKLKEQYNINQLILGFNHRFGCNKDEDFDDYVKHGTNLGVTIVKHDEYNGEFSPVSSSLIRKVIEEGRVDLAKEYLTQPYHLNGVVIYGKQNGRKIGFPTANLEVASELIIPHRGVYAVNVTLPDGAKRGGMANIGVRPTIEKGGERTIEVNIFDFDGDLYGKILNVEFIKFMRSEVKFASFEDLKNRLFIDRENCRKVLAK